MFNIHQKQLKETSFPLDICLIKKQRQLFEKQNLQI